MLKTSRFLLCSCQTRAPAFDHRHLTIAFSHLFQDLNKQTPEDDLTHLDEILALHDLQMDLPAGNKESFEKQSRANLSNRCLHHHVFDMALIKDVLKYFKLIARLLKSRPPCHLIAIRQKNKRGSSMTRSSLPK